MKLLGWTLCALLALAGAGAGARGGPGAAGPRGSGAAPALLLRDTTREYGLGRSWDVLAVRHDSAPDLSLAQVRAPAWAARFRYSQQAVPNFGAWQGQVWLRGTLVNAASRRTAWIIWTHIANHQPITIYLVAPDGQVRQFAAGPDLDFARTHAVPDRRYNFLLPLPLGQPTTVYVCTPGGLLDYSISERRQMEQSSYWENLFLNLFLGAMLMLALYNLFLFLSIKEVSYFYYVAYVLAFCALHLQMKGLLAWWFFPRLGEMGELVLQQLLNGLVMLFGALMARAFLDSRRLVPRLDWLLSGVVLLSPVPALAALFAHGALLGLLTLGLPLLSSLPLLVVGTAVLRRGYRPARYYMAGWGLVALSIFAFYLTQLNVLPVSGWTINGSAIAWVLEMVFLSLGLADRINLARQAEQQAQGRVLAMLREKEDAQQAANRQLAARATELEQANHELQASLATTGQLQNLDELKTNFFTNISHEFRTPLTLILGPAEELADEGPDPATRRKSGLILRNARRLLHLINQLLDLSKLEAGAMRLVPTAGDAAQLARQLAGTFASMAEARGIRFGTEGPVRLPLVFDAPKLEIVLTNLLSNALRFTPAGGEVALSWRAVAATTTAPALVELAVRDTGPGIAPEHLPQLFNRFYQGAHPTTPGAQPGTGVGLTLVKELTELHGGTVVASSAAGQGATFAVRLPYGLVPAPTAADEPVPALTGHDGTAAGAGDDPAETPPRPAAESPLPEADLVLFVEDNEDVREFIRSSLEPAGYRLLEAADGRAGVEMALASVPDLVISDVMMPGLDGYGVVRQLKAHPATSHVPVVLLTAKSAATDRLEGLETGADAYLGKPFAARELRAQVRNLLALRDRTRALTRAEQHLVLAGPPDPDGTPADEPAPTLAPARLSALDRDFLARVAASVEENLAESEFDVDQLSRAVALSRTQVQRKLRALTGQAPAEYIRTARLLRARALLREQAGTVAEIGYGVGFSSPAHFSTVFSRQFGYPPSEAARQ